MSTTIHNSLHIHVILNELKNYLTKNYSEQLFRQTYRQSVKHIDNQLTLV